MALGKPIQLVSPTGQNLTIISETHFYSHPDYERGLEILEKQEVVGYEGAAFDPEELSRFTGPMARWGEFFYSIFSRERHSASYPTLHDAVVCSGIKKGLNIFQEPTHVQRETCDPLFGDKVPTLPSLKQVTYLEPSGSLPLFTFYLFMGFNLLFLSASLFGLTALGSAILRKKGGVAFSKNSLELSYRVINMWSWPRAFFKWRGISLSPRKERVAEWGELGLYLSTLFYQFLVPRNDKMAKATNEMVARNRAERNMIVVGRGHHGIADILVEQYHYRKLPPN